MSVSIHYQRMADTRSRRYRALDIRLHASALNRKLVIERYERYERYTMLF